VHLAEQAGTPLLGDPLYGRVSRDADLERIAKQLGRQALHAAVLGFEQPKTHETMRFSAPPPADFAAALEALRSATPRARG
jgi:23S rRNA pseudouridine1911/1915/1917 synthase